MKHERHDASIRRRRWLTMSRIRSLSTCTIFFGSILWAFMLQHSFTQIITNSAPTRRMLETVDEYPASSAVAQRSSTSATVHTSMPSNDADDNNNEIEIVNHATSIATNTTNTLNKLNLPQWMKEYFAWHKSQLEDLNEHNWNQKKFLLMGCRKGDGECGGLSDRLKPLPLFLAVAHKTKRIFLIHWSTPHRLEEFLTSNLLNWTVPYWLEQNIPTNSYDKGTDDKVRNSNNVYQNTKGSKNLVKKMRYFRHIVFWEARAQDIFGGCALYHQVTTDTINVTQWRNKMEWNPMNGWDHYKTIYRDLFQALFVPSPPIRDLINNKMKAANLVPGKYTTAHYRAFYAIEDKKDTKTLRTLKRFALHAIDCAAATSPGVPIYFASDSKAAVKAANDYGSRSESTAIVTFSADAEEREALHLDKATDFETEPSDYYATFVDLLIMANGRCLAYGQGGFGLFASLLSHDANCTRQHSGKKKLFDCNSWKNSIDTEAT